MPKVPYPYEVNGKLVTGKDFLIPICSLSKRSLLPSLTVLWFNVCYKELLALRNNFRVTKKFLIAKFDCISCFNWIYRHFKLTCRPTLRAGLWRTKRQRTLATRPANPTEVKSTPWTAKSKRSKCVQLAIRELLMVNKSKEKLKRKCTRSKYIGSFRRCCTLDQLQSMRFDDWLTDGQKKKEVISLLYQNGRISKI